MSMESSIALAKLASDLASLRASHDRLLAAAKLAVSTVDTLRSVTGFNLDLAGLRDAIAAAEEQDTKEKTS